MTQQYSKAHPLPRKHEVTRLCNIPPDRFDVHLSLPTLIKYLTQEPWEYSVKPGEGRLPAVLIIEQLELDVSKHVEVDIKSIYRSFGVRCIYNDVEPLPEHSIKSLGSKGPWKVYDEYHKLSTINHSIQGKFDINIEGSDVRVSCQSTVEKISTTPNLSDSFDRQYTDRETVHAIFYLKSDWEFRFIEASDIRAALESAGYLVIRAHRPSIKHAGSSIGAAGYQGTIHINFRPLDPNANLATHAWPKYVAVTAGTDEYRVVNHPMTYQLGEHDALSGIVCLRNRPCHLPFRPPAPGKPVCNCNADDTARRLEAEQREVPTLGC